MPFQHDPANKPKTVRDFTSEIVFKKPVDKYDPRYLTQHLNEFFNKVHHKDGLLQLKSLIFLKKDNLIHAFGVIDLQKKVVEARERAIKDFWKWDDNELRNEICSYDFYYQTRESSLKYFQDEFNEGFEVFAVPKLALK
jgi:hypothetical protein